MYTLFSIFPRTCHWEFTQNIQWHFSVQNDMEVVKSDGETMRSLCVRHSGTYVVELGVGIGKGGESCRRKKGKRIVEERRGRICEGSYPCRR